ncbi:MAG: organic hydroperoxide reductase OsmC/OhrA [Verrucomicrobiales bacterium]|jgi:organic hydroperoxide reductase OsmC/OhrA
MSEHRVELDWKRETEGFSYKEYSRNHTWKFDNGEVVRASAAVDFQGDGGCVDPEAAYAASLSSCHALTFLALASMQKLTVDSYSDKAVAFLEKDPETKKPVVTRVELRPVTVFADGVEVSREQLEQLHHKAHEGCFIANSVKTEIVTVLD